MSETVFLSEQEAEARFRELHDRLLGTMLETASEGRNIADLSEWKEYFALQARLGLK